MLNQPNQNKRCEKMTTVEQYLRKAPGEGGISAELLKKGGKVIITKIQQPIEKIRKTRQ